MVKIILRDTNLMSELNPPELSLVKGNLLLFADNPSDSGYISQSPPPQKAYLSISDLSDVQQLSDLCTRFKDIEIIIETTPQFNDSLQKSGGSLLSIIQGIIEKSPITPHINEDGTSSLFNELQPDN